MALVNLLFVFALSASATNTLPSFTVDPFGRLSITTSVVMNGDLTVKSTKQKAIYLPEGGIHLSTTDSGPTPPGQMFVKNIKTSTITLIGSAILFEDGQGQVLASMTDSELHISGISAGKVQNKNTGAGAPVASSCDDVSEFGLQYISRTPSRLWLCADDGAGGYEWRYTNISP